MYIAPLSAVAVLPPLPNAEFPVAMTKTRTIVTNKFRIFIEFKIKNMYNSNSNIIILWYCNS